MRPFRGATKTTDSGETDKITRYRVSGVHQMPVSRDGDDAHLSARRVHRPPERQRNAAENREYVVRWNCKRVRGQWWPAT